MSPPPVAALSPTLFPVLCAGKRRSSRGVEKKREATVGMGSRRAVHEEMENATMQGCIKNLEVSPRFLDGVKLVFGFPEGKRD